MIYKISTEPKLQCRPCSLSVAENSRVEKIAMLVLDKNCEGYKNIDDLSRLELKDGELQPLDVVSYKHVTHDYILLPRDQC